MTRSARRLALRAKADHARTTTRIDARSGWCAFSNRVADYRRWARGRPDSVSSVRTATRSWFTLNACGAFLTCQFASPSMSKT